MSTLFPDAYPKPYPGAPSGVGTFVPGHQYASSAPSSTLLDSLVSYWKLDEESGTRYDSVGTNHLTDNNTVGFDTGVDGAAASFVAANSEYLRSDVCPFSGATTVSAGAWVRLTGLGGTYPAIIDTGTNARAFEVHFGTQDQVSLYYGFTNSAGLVTNGPYVFTRDQWHWIYASYDDGNWELYMDNVKLGGWVHGSGALIASSELEISGPFYYGSYVNGQIDEVAIWSRVLTADERAELYAAGAGKFYPFT